MKRSYPIVEVHWVDSQVYHGWAVNSAVKDVGVDSLDCVSVGLLLEETADRIVLMLSYSRDAKHSVLAIPKVAITKIVVVRK